MRYTVTNTQKMCCAAVVRRSAIIKSKNISPVPGRADVDVFGYLINTTVHLYALKYRSAAESHVATAYYSFLGDPRLFIVFERQL